MLGKILESTQKTLNFIPKPIKLKQKGAGMSKVLDKIFGISMESRREMDKFSIRDAHSLGTKIAYLVQAGYGSAGNSLGTT